MLTSDPMGSGYGNDPLYFDVYPDTKHDSGPVRADQTFRSENWDYTLTWERQKKFPLTDMKQKSGQFGFNAFILGLMDQKQVMTHIERYNRYAMVTF